MPAGKTKFKENWREKEDSNGTIIKKWCKLGHLYISLTADFARAKTCDKCDNNGEAALHTCKVKATCQE